MNNVKIDFQGLVKDQFKYLVSIGDETFEYWTGLRWATLKKPDLDRPFYNVVDVSGMDLKAKTAILKALKPMQRVTYYDCEILHRIWVSLPNPKDVLECLFSDLDAGEMSFDDFCDNFGYSNDSIKALDTYRACSENARKMRRLIRGGLVQRPESESQHEHSS